MNYTLGLYEKALPAGLDWETMLTSAKESGFDQLEISIDETDERLSRLDWTPEQRWALVRLMQKTGVPIRTMCLSGHRKYPLGSHDPAVRERSLEIMYKAVDLAADLGIRIIQLAGYDVYYEEGDAQTRAFFNENLKKSVDYAAKKSVTLGFETMETPFMDTISKSMAYVRQIDSPYLGVYPDLGNLTNACYLYNSDIGEEIRCGKGHMYAMHLKETVEGKYRDMDFGDGRVEFVSGVREALACGIRLYTAEFWHDGREDWKNRLSSVSSFLRKAFQQAQT